MKRTNRELSEKERFHLSGIVDPLIEESRKIANERNKNSKIEYSDEYPCGHVTGCFLWSVPSFRFYFSSECISPIVGGHNHEWSIPDTIVHNKIKISLSRVVVVGTGSKGHWFHEYVPENNLVEK